MKIAALQTVSATHVGANLDSAAALLAQAAEAGAELAVLPEYFCLMGRQDTDKLAVREGFGSGEVQDFLARQAKSLGLWIVGGTLPLAAGDAAHVSNTSLAFSPQGQCVARYDKIHLFKFDNGREQYDESRVIEAGDTPRSFVLPSRDCHACKVGLSVCYDLRFPELYRGYRDVALILVPSAFTAVTGAAHWHILLKARAIENQCYVLAAAQGGTHANGRRTYGHSVLIDPWGTVVAELAEGEGVIVGEIDSARIAQVRRDLPALSHRRPA
jgi:nitrilase